MTWAGPRSSIAARTPEGVGVGLPFAREVPRWPLTAIFIGVPLWWVSGFGDLILPIAASVMLFLMARLGRIEVPRGFGIWLLFLLWMLFSVIGIDSGGRLIGFVYRAAMYAAATVIFLYVYNGRRYLTPRYLAGMLTGYWLLIVGGGYLGIIIPTFSITTPLAVILPDAVLSNELVQEIAYRRVTQFDPTSATALEPRPSAPFLYTNGWGNAYSLLMPIVVAYLGMVRGLARFWWVLAAIPASLVPAFLTLNRGMFLGLGLALAYVVLRLTLQGRMRAVGGLIGLFVVVAAVFTALPAQERLTERLETSATTETRLGLYEEAIDRTMDSPLLGYGAPRPSEQAGAPAVGTQGQVWMVLFSHGFPGAVLFLGWLVWVYVRTLRHPGGFGLACNTVLLVTLAECFYYGVLTSGLPIAMIAAGYAMRPGAVGDATTAGGRTA